MNQPSQPTAASPVLNPQATVYVAGHRGMVGSAILRALQRAGCKRLITQTHAQLDLVDQAAVRDFFNTHRMDYVVLAAARVGGIMANQTQPAEFIYQNLMIEANLIHEAWRAGVQRLLFLGSSCIYPKHAPQPMREEDLLTGYLEPTNEPYAIAKIAGIKLCESYNRQYGTHYRAVMPTNLYGPGDNFDLENSHVLAALIRKFHLAKLASTGDRRGMQRDAAAFGPIPEDVRAGLLGAGSRGDHFPSPKPAVRLWGSGRPRREFLHVDDLASACLRVMSVSDQQYAETLQPAPPDPASGQPKAELPRVSHINIGTGTDLSIGELARMVQNAVGCAGDPVWDDSRPDGAPQKLLEVSRVHRLGWQPQIALADGIARTYRWYLNQTGDNRRQSVR
jgi:GDP-L-fucose synthase